MSYTIIPDLPVGGSEHDHLVDVFKNLLVIEQDITRKITPLLFLTDSLPQLIETSTITGDNLIPLSDFGMCTTGNLTVDNLMKYINTHLNVIDVVFFVSSVSGVDSLDFSERGRNEQLPFRTIKFAAQQISNLIAQDKNYDLLNPNLVPDNTVDAPSQITSKTRKQYTIMVRSGDYVEINPVYLPPNTSMIGDNLRRTTIRPQNPQLDMFWVDSANYIWGFTFKGHKDPSAAVAFPISTAIYNIAANTNILQQYAPYNYTPVTGNSNGWVQDSYNFAYMHLLPDQNLGGSNPAINSSVVPNNRPFIYVSPYVQGCTSYALSDRMPNNRVGDNTNNPLYKETWYTDSENPTTPTTEPPPNNAGMGMRIDGSLVNGYFRSMVLDSFTQVNQGGKGVYILNHGYAQLVSIFTVATYQGIVCESGGTCSISTSNSTFGLSGLVATGKSYSQVLSGLFIIPDTLAYPISSASSANGNSYGVYGYSVGSNLFSINQVTPVPVVYPNDDVADIEVQGNGPMVVASQPYATLCFTVGDDKPWISGYNGGIPIYSGPGYLMEGDMNPTVSRFQGTYFPNSPAANSQMHQVKLFYIEQGPPVPTLSGGSSLRNGVYDIYDYYSLSKPPIPSIKPNIGLSWDIDLSFNISLDLRNHSPLKSYDVNGYAMHFNIEYDGKPKAINYQYWDNGSLVPVISGTPGAWAEYKAALGANGTIDFTNAPVKFYARSVVETGSHTFEYMGTGTRMKYAIPAFGGVTNNADECAADGFNDPYGNAPGTVFFTSSNELGNFKVGKDFTIVQSTGTIQGDTFSRAILTLVTPLNIVLE